MSSAGFYIFLLFNVSFFLRFAYRLPVTGTIRLDMLLVFSMFVCLVFTLQGNKKEVNEISKKFKIILIFILISLPLVKWPGSVLLFGFKYYLKAIVFFIFTTAFVDTEKKLKVLITVFLFCQLFRIIEPAYLHITEGYWGSAAYSVTEGGLAQLDRLSSAPADVLNPTQFAGLIVTIIPFLYFLFWKSPIKIFKLLFLCLCPVLLYVLSLTGARSGVLCLLIVISTIFFFDLGGKMQPKALLYSAIVIAPLLLIAFQLLPQEFAERYLSLIDSSAAGHDTAVGRIRGLTGGFENLLTPFIIFGYGLGTSAEANYHVMGENIISHSLYLETAQELGFIGLILVLKYFQSIFKSLAQANQALEGCEEKYRWNLNLIKAIQAWAAMFLVYGTICFGLSSWEWYFFGGLSAVSFKFANQYQKEGL